MYIFLSLAVIAMIFRAAFMSLGARNERKRNLTTSLQKLPFISVIIPARNEENNIQLCLEQLSKSTYPIENYEIIVVNDRSDDNTGLILDNLQDSISNLKVIHVTESNKIANLKGKPGALQTGINNASGEIIMMTDADCRVNLKWIETVASQFDEDKVGLVASFTLIDANSLFEKIQAVEWLYMHTMASAGIGFDQPLGCFGNNLSIRTSVMKELGGYENIKFSLTEDLALLQAVFKSKYKVKYLTNYDASVVTLPCTTFAEYVSQHRRWAVGGLDLKWRAAVFVLTFVLMWIGVITAAFTNNYIWLSGILILRAFADFSVIYPSTIILKQNRLLPMILPTILFLMIIEIFIPLTLINRKIIWKGQVFKR